MKNYYPENLNIYWHDLAINKEIRGISLGHKPTVLWFTGISGAGKSTVANLIEKRLFIMGRRTYLLDGDNVRHGLNRNLGFEMADRIENIRRIGEVSKLFVDAGLIVLCSFISPFRQDRDMVRNLLEPNEFIEIFVDVSLAVAESRDPKGLYKRARAGEIKNFTGLDSPYEPPINPEIYLDANIMTPDEMADFTISYLKKKYYIIS